MRKKLQKCMGKIRHFLTIAVLLSMPNMGAMAQDAFYIQAESIGKFISSELSNSPMKADRDKPGSWEEFEIENLPNGKVAFKATINNTYVSSENGAKAMNCDRPEPGSWEQFTLEKIAGDLYAIKGNNGKYVSHSKGTGLQLTCTEATIGTAEGFVFIDSDTKDACGGTLNPPDSWHDSYESNGFCWCDTNYDHGLDNINEVSFMINGIARSIPTICEELKKHPLYKAYQSGDPIFNDIQCGNGPPNSDSKLDEQCCPGRVGIGTIGCSMIGVKWDIEWLESRPVFSAGVDEFVNIKASSINRYVSSENASEPMKADRVTPGTWEEFGLSYLPNGKAAFIATINGSYISSENGAKAMNCDRPDPGTWEQFTLENVSGNTYAIKGSNGKYMTHSAGTGVQLFCNATTIGTNQLFDIEVINASSRVSNSVESSIDLIDDDKISIYPNPLSGNVLHIDAHLTKGANSSISIVDFTGKTVLYKDLGWLESGDNALHLEGIRTGTGQLAGGIYFVRINLGNKELTQKVVLK